MLPEQGRAEGHAAARPHAPRQVVHRREEPAALGVSIRPEPRLRHPGLEEHPVPERRQAPARRKLVERAKGLLQRDMGLTEEEAYLTLQRQARQRRLTMKQVAEAIVLSDDVKRFQAGGKDTAPSE